MDRHTCAFLALPHGASNSARRPLWKRKAVGRRPAADGAKMVLAGEKRRCIQDLYDKLKKELPGSLDSDGPTDTSIYTDNVLFLDPLNNFRGAERQKKNIEMLKNSAFMTSDGFDLHDIWIDEQREAVMTRWTLRLCFKLLPWKPVLTFTGTSEYGLSDDLLVDRHIDKWDSVTNNTPPSIEAVRDLIGEMFKAENFTSADRTLSPSVIRRDVSGYEIRDIPSSLVLRCAYRERGEGIARLEQYFGGANATISRVPQLSPLLLSFMNGLEGEKTMSSFVGGRADHAPATNVSGTELVTFGPLRVAVIKFKEPILSSVARSKEKELEALLRNAGVRRVGSAVHLAQYGAVYTLPWLRRNELWLEVPDDTL